MLRDLDAEMRRREHYHRETILENLWIIVRLDGRSFTRLTQGYRKPFDPEFSAYMCETTSRLMYEFDAVYGYTQSDEISLVFRPGFDLFGRSHEKIVSLTAGAASAFFTHTIGSSAQMFDSRVWLGSDTTDVISYMRWRQLDASRCAVNGYAYWTLRNQRGLGARAATKILEGRDTLWKIKMLTEHGVDFNALPRWESGGIGYRWQYLVRVGHNPITDEDVEAVRRTVTSRDDLPTGDSYAEFIYEVLTDAS